MKTLAFSIFNKEAAEEYFNEIKAKILAFDETAQITVEFNNQNAAEVSIDSKVYQQDYLFDKFFPARLAEKDKELMPSVSNIAFLIRVRDLPISIRLFHILNVAGYEYVGDIASLSGEKEFRKLRNAGKVSFTELNTVLKMLNLKFGDNPLGPYKWLPKNVAELSEKYFPTPVSVQKYIDELS